MQVTGNKLSFASGPSVGAFTGGRGEVDGTLQLYYHHEGQWVAVAALEEYDRRPFYDAWECCEVQSARLLELPGDAGLAIVVCSHSDAEWNVGGPMQSLAVYRSENGANWQPAAWDHNTMSRAVEVEVLEARPKSTSA